MRLKNIPPASYNSEQSELYGVLSASITKHLQSFVTARSDGALIGPFNILLHFPRLGSAVWSVFSALADNSTLPAPVREIAILLTGAKNSALYELYSHESVARSIGMPPESVASFAAGLKPEGLSREERVAFDIASTLNRGGPLPDSLYRLGVETFGTLGMAELACTVGCYTTISTLLNTFDVALPGTELADDGNAN